MTQQRLDEPPSVELLLYAAALDLLQTARFAFLSRRTVQAAIQIVEEGSRRL